MRFAGTWRRYSNRAMDQLTMAATYQALDRRSLRWAYQANVMKTFEHVSSPVVRTNTRIRICPSTGHYRPASPMRRRIWNASDQAALEVDPAKIEVTASSAEKGRTECGSNLSSRAPGPASRRGTPLSEST